MHNPAHPAELLSGWLDDLALSDTAKERTQIKRVAVPELVAA